MGQLSDSSPVISVEGLTKQFPGVRALENVSFSVLPGEVHGLIGENGAGKSTLMKILSGIYWPTTGVIRVGGQSIVLARGADAQRLGVVMIHQELNLVDELNVAENIFLGRETTRLGWIDRRWMRREARRLLAGLQCDIPPTTKVKFLSVARKQMVEIAKALSCRASVLIMDEPTAVLSSRETDALFAVIRHLKSTGVAIIYISHILPEVRQICDRVTVMRDGRIVKTLEGEHLAKSGERDLASLMVGRPMRDHFPRRVPHDDQVVLTVDNLRVAGNSTPNSLEVRRGEILGFAGLIGAGRTELAEAIAGLRRVTDGHVEIDGKPANIRSPRDAVSAGIAYLSEDRKGSGLTLGMSVIQNTTLVSLVRYCRPWIDFSAEARATAGHVSSLGIRVPRLHAPIDLLSGGNQQKIAIAKWLEINPKVLILDEPTRGVDIGAKEQIYAVIQSLTRQGMALILISSELNEVLGMSHRIAVMRAGKIVDIVDAAAATEDSLMHLATGVSGHVAG